jgi:hypothetical protein
MSKRRSGLEYNKDNFIPRYTKKWYEEVFPVKFKDEIERSSILITDEWGNIIGYNIPYKNLFY